MITNFQVFWLAEVNGKPQIDPSCLLLHNRRSWNSGPVTNFSWQLLRDFAWVTPLQLFRGIISTMTSAKIACASCLRGMGGSLMFFRLITRSPFPDLSIPIYITLEKKRKKSFKTLKKGERDREYLLWDSLIWCYNWVSCYYLHLLTDHSAY